jgi:hypothetical protein
MGRPGERVGFGKIVALGFLHAGLVHAPNGEGGASERERLMLRSRANA